MHFVAVEDVVDVPADIDHCHDYSLSETEDRMSDVEMRMREGAEDRMNMHIPARARQVSEGGAWNGGCQRTERRDDGFVVGEGLLWAMRGGMGSNIYGRADTAEEWIHSRVSLAVEQPSKRSRCGCPWTSLR
jgi:hypothetical protein